MSHMKHTSKRIGRLNEKGHPWGAFPCRDGWVAIAAGNKGFKVLADVMGIPEMHDPKFGTPFGRLMHHDELDAYMMPWLLEHDKEKIFHMIGGNVPQTAGGMVLDMKEIVESPILAHLDYFNEIDHPIAGKAIYPGAPFKLSETPWQTGRAPLLGEHTAEVLQSLLGYREKYLEQLKKDAVIQEGN